MLHVDALERVGVNIGCARQYGTAGAHELLRSARLATLRNVQRLLHAAVSVQKVVEAAPSGLAHTKAAAAEWIGLPLVSIAVPIINLSFGEIVK